MKRFCCILESRVGTSVTPGRLNNHCQRFQCSFFSFFAGLAMGALTYEKLHDSPIRSARYFAAFDAARIDRVAPLAHSWPTSFASWHAPFDCCSQISLNPMLPGIIMKLQTSQSHRNLLRAGCIHETIQKKGLIRRPLDRFTINLIDILSRLVDFSCTATCNCKPSCKRQRDGANREVSFNRRGNGSSILALCCNVVIADGT